ncbi:MAG: hypothetical protein Kow0031_31380 [Anaerolineae bacterium]
MAAQGYQNDPTIEQWHHNFEQVQRLWADWCIENAARFDSAAEAWGVFIKEYQQQISQPGNGSGCPEARLFI